MFFTWNASSQHERQVKPTSVLPTDNKLSDDMTLQDLKNTPDPLPQNPKHITPTSEGEGRISTSEGGNINIGNRVKKNITDMSTTNIPKHPSLYSSIPTPPSNETRRLHAPSGQQDFLPSPSLGGGDLSPVPCTG